MHIPRWKIWLSYLADVPLEKAAAGFNPPLELGLRKGRLYLNTPNATYSYGDLYANFRARFSQVDFKKYQFQTGLLLGFGMGSVPFMLEKVFQKKAAYHAVEADPQVAAWAEKYVLPALTSPIRLHVADAMDFVKKCPEKFDLIVMDVFVDDVVPPVFKEIFFLEHLKNLLHPKGLLLYNCLADTPRLIAHNEDFFTERFQQVFPMACYLSVGGNWILQNRVLEES